MEMKLNLGKFGLWIRRSTSN